MPSECHDGHWTKRVPFELKEFQEAAGAHTGMQTSKAETDTPVSYIEDVIIPDNLKSGKITRIRIRVNHVNAVTLEALRFYKDAKAGDYESSSCKIFDTIGLYPAGLVDDDEYNIDLNIDFILAAEGKLYYAPQWSAACGNVQFYIVIEGETFE